MMTTEHTRDTFPALSMFIYATLFLFTGSVVTLIAVAKHHGADFEHVKASLTVM